jgi:hypothetical protein
MKDKHAENLTDRRADDANFPYDNDEARVNTDIEWCDSRHGTVLHKEVFPRQDI